MRLAFFYYLIFAVTATNAQSNNWSLQRCINHALQNNVSVLQYQLQGEIIENNLKQAKLNRLPTLNGSGSHNYNIGRSIDPFTNTFSTQTIQSNSFGLSTGVLVYGGNLVNKTIAQNSVAQEANLAGTEVIKNQIALQVSSTYLMIIQAEENLKVAQSQQDLTQNQLARANKLAESGSINKSMVYSLRAQLANDKVQIINAENQIQLAYNTMINLLQLDEMTDFEVDDVRIEELPAMPKENVAELFELSYSTLPEIRKAELDINQSKIGENIAASSLQPRLSAYGNINTVYSESGLVQVYTGDEIIPIGLTETSNEVVYGVKPNYEFNKKSFSNQMGDNLGQSVGVSLSVPIFNGYRNKTSLENAKVSTKISELNMESTKNQLKNDITNAYTNLKVAKSRYDAALLSIEAQKQNFDFAQKRFEAGLSNSNDLLTAKNQWFAAQLQLTNAKYEYVFRNLIIEFYKGNDLKL